MAQERIISILSRAIRLLLQETRATLMAVATTVMNIALATREKIMAWLVQVIAQMNIVGHIADT